MENAMFPIPFCKGITTILLQMLVELMMFPIPFCKGITTEDENSWGKIRCLQYCSVRESQLQKYLYTVNSGCFQYRSVRESQLSSSHNANIS